MTTHHKAIREISPTAHTSVRELSDDQLPSQLSALIREERRLTVAVLVHLAEVERRGLHLARGCASLFAYCVQRLGFSEDVAHKRVGASRYGSRLPFALHLLDQGALNLSILMLVGPHLTETNHREWLTAVVGKSKREVELLVAARCPKPDAPSSARKLPVPSSGCKLPNRQAGIQDPTDTDSTATIAPPSGAGASLQAGTSPAGSAPKQADTSLSLPAEVAPLREMDSTSSQQVVVPASQQVPDVESHALRSRAAERSQVHALSGSTFRVVFTASERLKEKLDRARELCSHRIAPTDLPALFECALDLLLEREEKRRCAVRSTNSSSPKRAKQHRTSPPISRQDEQDPDPVEARGAATRPSGLEIFRTETEVDDRPGPEVLGTKTGVDDRVGVATGRASKPATGLRKPSSEFSRHVPAAVRRAVWERGEGQCTFVDAQGNRCTERQSLEIDHIVAHARGGPTTVANCRLLCRAHNQYWARVTFGADFVERVRARHEPQQSTRQSASQ